MLYRLKKKQLVLLVISFSILFVRDYKNNERILLFDQVTENYEAKWNKE